MSGLFGVVDLAAPRVDVDRGEVVGLGAAARVDEHAGVGISGEGEAGESGPGRRRRIALWRARRGDPPNCHSVFLRIP